MKFAVIISHSGEKWVFCKHKDRDTYEVPGGRREPGESILETVRRELREETGALEFEIHPICVYSVTGRTRAVDSDEETFGMLYHAHITSFKKNCTVKLPGLNCLMHCRSNGHILRFSRC